VLTLFLHLLFVEKHVGDAFADGERTGAVLALEFALLHVDLVYITFITPQCYISKKKRTQERACYGAAWVRVHH
jgi:hypothetical protein